MISEWQPLNASKLGGLPDFTYTKIQKELLSLHTDSSKHLIRHETGFQNSRDILKPDPQVLEFAKQKALDPFNSGYTHSCGIVANRKGLASILSFSNCSLTENNIIFFSGEDMAINHTMRAFCNPGDNFLVPCPTQGHWVDSAPGYNFEARQYKLDPKNGWKIDLKDLESKIDSKTKFIVIMNPSYPTGAVYQEEELRNIIKIAENHMIPIVADEIYLQFTFSAVKTVSIASISGEVPVVTIGGLGKQFCIPGFRFSWVAFYDRVGALKEFIPAFQNIMQLMLHPPPYLQQLVPEIFEKGDKDHISKLMAIAEENYNTHVGFIKKNLSKHFSLSTASGGESFVAMINADSFKDIKNCEDFSKKLLIEQNIMVLPTSAFHLEGGIVISNFLNGDDIKEFHNRLEEFCGKHSK